MLSKLAMKSPPKKLIEVALPLAEINAASVREKSICLTWCAATLQEHPRARWLQKLCKTRVSYALCNAHLLRELTLQAEFRDRVAL